MSLYGATVYVARHSGSCCPSHLLVYAKIKSVMNCSFSVVTDDCRDSARATIRDAKQEVTRQVAFPYQFKSK